MNKSSRPFIGRLGRVAIFSFALALLVLPANSRAYYNLGMFWRAAVNVVFSIKPLSFDYPIGSALNQTFTATTGTGLTYSLLAGPGSINSSTGDFSSSVGGRTVGQKSYVRVTNPSSTVSNSIINHARLSVNGAVNAAVTDGTSLYIGGDFTAINPHPAYGFTSVDATTGVTSDLALASAFNGTISAIAVSGTKAYIGGTFTKYMGTTVQNLVKVDLTTGALDTTFTQSTGPGSGVLALALSGANLYVGGAFTTYRGDSKGYRLAKVDATTGVLDTTNFNTTASSGPNGSVNALALSGTNLYVGGGFTNYRGDTKGYYVAKVDATTGVLDTTNFNTTASSGPDNTVNALVISGADLYVGGSFTAYRSDTKGYRLAKVDATTGALDTTNFNTTASSGPAGAVNALALSGASLYVGGGYTSYRGDAKGYYLAKVDATTGALDTTNFNTTASSGPSSSVYALTLSGTNLYVGGFFTSYRGDTKGYYLAKVDATTGAMDTTNFNTTANSGPNAQINALALSGTNLYVGGNLTTYRGTPASRLAKIDLATWLVDTTFTQSTGPNGVVNALLLSGTSLYVGGGFATYRGDSKGYYLAKVDTTTGALDTTNFNTTANSGPNNWVHALALSGANLYVGGQFTSYRGDTKGYRLVKVDATTGALDTTNFNTTASSGPDNTVNALVLSGANLYVGGSFTAYRSDTKGYRLAKVDTTTGALDTTNFNTTASSGPGNTVYALALSGADLYLGGQFTSYRGDSKGYFLAKVDATTGVLDTTNFNTTASSGPGTTVNALALSGANLYVGGQFVAYRGNSKGYRLAKVDATTGVLDTTNFNTTASTGPDSTVSALALSGSTLYAGGAFTSYRGNFGSPYILPVDTTTGAELFGPSPTLNPLGYTYPIGKTLNETFTASGGSGSGYNYSVLSGAGSINSGTGAYTSSIGQRAAGATTKILVSDSANSTATSTLTHARLSVNGNVRAAVSDGTSLYIGGDFTEINPLPAYGFTAVDATTGVTSNLPLSSAFNGTISAIVTSGTTAYIGGTFTSYMGTTVQNLVKIDLTTGALDTTFTQSTGPNSSVTALALSGSALYVGGGFGAYRGDSKGYYLAKVDATTGAMDTTNFNTTASAGPNGSVNALALSGANLYVGGNFTTYRGDTKGYYLAKVDATTGVMDTTNFNTTASSGPSTTVYALAVSGADLYVGGNFTTYRGDTKGYYLAKVDATTGALDTTNFNTTASSGPTSNVTSLALSGANLYVGGSFTTYRGDSKGYYLAKVDATTGALDTTNFNTTANSGPLGTVNSLALSGANLYVGGNFTAYRGDPKGYRLVKVDATTGVMDTTNFNTTASSGPNNQVNAIALSGANLYVGGTFTTYRGTPAPYLAKINLSTWVVDTTFTQSTGPNNPVYALALSGANLYVGGNLTSYRGDTKGYYLAKVDATTGALDTTNFNTTANSGPSSTVNTLVLSGSNLYVGGGFTSYRGDAKGYYLAKVDATTGALDTTNFNTTASSGPNTSVQALALSGTSLYVAGSFTSYRGDTKGYYLAKVDTTTGAMDTTNFNTTASSGPGSAVSVLALSGANLYVGGQFTTYRGDAKGYRLAKVDATTGALDTTNFNTTASSGPSGQVLALALSGTDLYVGGVFTQYRADSKGYYLAKVNATTGVMDTTNFNTTASSGPSNWVYSLALSGSSLFVGGSFTNYRGNMGSPYILPVSATTGIEQ